MSDPGNQAYSWAAAMDRCDELLARAERAEAERDALRETLAAVLKGWNGWQFSPESPINRARAALAAGERDE